MRSNLGGVPIAKQDSSPGSADEAGLRFNRIEFPAADGRVVLAAGTGPPVVVMHELYGMTKEVRRFAQRLVNEKFRVYLPVLAGPDSVDSKRDRYFTAARLCVSFEFGQLAHGKTSTFVDWLRGLIAYAAQQAVEEGRTGLVGVVGMCFTGGFALAAAAEPPVSIAVSAEPSLPAPFGRRRSRDLGMSDSDIAKLSERVRVSEVCVIALRFSNDRISPAVRFTRLATDVPLRSENLVEVNSARDNPEKFRRCSHSVLTNTRPVTPAGRQRLEFITARVVAELQCSLGRPPNAFLVHDP